jgi:glucose-1-phosphate thymidylyltransferase
MRRDPVVCARLPVDEIRGVVRRPAVEDDEDVVAVLLAPAPAPFHELPPRDVRPLRAPYVLRIDKHGDRTIVRHVKGVILAGGSGTRLYPLTRITNKHLLPLYDRPMVTYAIEALVGAGIDEIMLVTGGTHAGEFFRLLGNGHEYGIERLFYAYQDQAGGIADALALAERFVNRDKVCVLLADNIFENSLRFCVENFGRQESGGRILLARMEEEEHLRHLGVPVLDGDRVVRIEEKPQEPKSAFAVTGAYFYDEAVWDFLPTLAPSARGELEITDVNNWYVEQGLMQSDTVNGFWGDAGESIEAYYAVNDFVRQNGVNR